MPPRPETISGLPRAFEIVTGVVAPTTLITALMFWFGWSHAYSYCMYFGVNSTLLDFTTQEYLMRSVDGLFVPATATAVLVLSVFLLRQILHRLRPAALDEDEPSTVYRVAVWTGLAIGLLLSGIGLAAALGAWVLSLPYASALALAVGAVLVAWAIHVMRQWRGQDAQSGAGWVITEWATTFTIVSLALFWAVSDYSANVGTSEAQLTHAALASQPGVVLFSAKNLGLSRLPGVRPTTCSDPDAAYRVRYDGLVLLFESGNQYMLLPRDWNPGLPSIVLPRTDTIRLEFTPAERRDQVGVVAC